MYTIQNPFAYFNSPTNSKPIGLGHIYIGLKNTDPTLPENQIDVFAVQSCECEEPYLQIQQPIQLLAGGIPSYNGAPIQIVTSEVEYSISVKYANGNHAYYTPLVTGNIDVEDDLSYVNGIKKLTAISNATLNVVGFYENTTVGGGQFIYDASRSVADHNGGTVIAASAIADWDGTQADIATLLDWTGTGIGCFVKINIIHVSPEDFGAIGDWDGATGTNDNSSWQKCIDSGVAVKGRHSARYRIVGTLERFNGDIDVDLNGGELIQDSDNPTLHIEQDYLNISSISEIAPASITLTNGDSGATTPTIRLLVPANSDFETNDFVKIFSDDKYPWLRPEDNERKGEFAKLARVTKGFPTAATDALYTYSYLKDEYPTNPRVAKLQSDKVVKVYNGKVSSSTSDNPTWSREQIYIAGCFEPFVSIQSDYCRAELLILEGCLAPKTLNMSAKTQTTSFANFAYGYTVVEYSCERGVHLAPSGYDCRHVYTTGIRATDSGSASVKSFGATRDFKVAEGFGSNCQNSAFDTHPDSIGGVFIDCQAIQPYNGPNGTQLNYQLRGQGAKLIGCKSIGGTGLRIFSNGIHQNSGADNEAVDFEHDYLDTVQNFRYAFEIYSDGVHKVKGTRLVNPKTKQSTGRWQHIYATNTEDIDVINPNFNAAHSGAGEGNTLYADNAKIKIHGGKIDLTGSSDTDLRICNLASDESVIEINGTEIISDFPIYLARFNETAAKLLATVKTNQQLKSFSPSAPIGVTNFGVNSRAKIQYSTGGDLDSSPSIFSETYTAGGDKTIDIRLRGSDRLYCNLYTSAGNPRINNITNGIFQGQMITLANDPTSAGFMTLKNENSIDIVSDYQIDIGRSVSLVWVGVKWRLS